MLDLVPNVNFLVVFAIRYTTTPFSRALAQTDSPPDRGLHHISFCEFDKLVQHLPVLVLEVLELLTGLILKILEPTDFSLVKLLLLGADIHDLNLRPHSLLYNHVRNILEHVCLVVVDLLQSTRDLLIEMVEVRDELDEAQIDQSKLPTNSVTVFLGQTLS